MILDIILLVLMLVFAFLGFKKGFLRSVVAILKGIVSLIVAIILARPLASFLDRLFSLGRLIGRLFLPTVEGLSTSEWWTTEATAAANATQLETIKGSDFVSTILAKIVERTVGGAGDSIIGNTPAAYAATVLGFFALIVLCAVIIFVVVRILLRILDKYIKKLTENQTGFVVDAWLGALFGILRFLISVMCWMMFLFVLSSIPFINGIAEWLFSGSVICHWLFEATGSIVLWFFRTFDVVSFVVGALGLG